MPDEDDIVWKLRHWVRIWCGAGVTPTIEFSTLNAAADLIGRLRSERLADDDSLAEGIVEIGMALGLPRPTADHHWGAPEILAHIREQADPTTDAARLVPEGSRPTVRERFTPLECLDLLLGWAIAEKSGQPEHLEAWAGTVADALADAEGREAKALHALEKVTAERDAASDRVLQLRARTCDMAEEIERLHRQRAEALQELSGIIALDWHLDPELEHCLLGIRRFLGVTDDV